MAKYSGLTNDPEDRRKQHGYPSDWRIFGPFRTEEDARRWEVAMLALGLKGGGGGEGWRYGYTYTITPSTKEG